MPAGARHRPQDRRHGGRVLPRCDVEAMNLHLAEIARHVNQLRGDLTTERFKEPLAGRLTKAPRDRVVRLGLRARPVQARLTLNRASAA
jgi:hypothetical protein